VHEGEAARLLGVCIYAIRKRIQRSTAETVFKDCTRARSLTSPRRVTGADNEFDAASNFRTPGDADAHVAPSKKSPII
jgi:hypothetical protein